MAFLTDLVLQCLLFINSLVGNIGLAIIIFTVLFRLIILSFTYKSLKSMGKMRELNGELKELRKKYKNDPQALNLAQLELYKRHNINPLSGCLPQLLQIFMLIVFYNALRQLIGMEGLAGTQFLWFDVTTPDSYHVIPIIAVISQLFLSLMISPGGETPNLVPDEAKKKSLQELNKKEEDTAEMAAMMQKQMLFMMPLMSGFIAWGLPAGLGFYWIVSTIFSIGQQFFISGAGGLKIYAHRLALKFKK
jgi:YidC/Oxa1 family membrane protein insertase